MKVPCSPIDFSFKLLDNVLFLKLEYFLVLLALVMVGEYFVFIDKEPHGGEMLQTISICPEGDVVRKPRFDKDSIDYGRIR